MKGMKEGIGSNELKECEEVQAEERYTSSADGRGGKKKGPRKERGGVGRK